MWIAFLYPCWAIMWTTNRPQERRGRELCCVITLNEEKIKLKLFLDSHTSRRPFSEEQFMGCVIERHPGESSSSHYATFGPSLRNINAECMAEAH
jgi:hypothetical protein